MQNEVEKTGVGRRESEENEIKGNFIRAGFHRCVAGLRIKPDKNVC